MHILLDTSVISEARRPNPVEEVKRFLRSLPSHAVAIPPPVIFELERGGQMLKDIDPPRSERLLGWLEQVLDTTVHIPTINADVARIVARMATVPQFRKFWTSTKKLEFGCDPMIAAVAIHYGMPIATRDISDFLLIHQEFHLPGLYEPMAAKWFIEPSEEWEFALRDDSQNCLVF